MTFEDETYEYNKEEWENALREDEDLIPGMDDDS